MKLPVVSGTEVVKALGKIGYELDVQHGSHMILRHSAPPHRRLSVPDHKEVAKGTLRKPSATWALRSKSSANCCSPSKQSSHAGNAQRQEPGFLATGGNGAADGRRQNGEDN